MAWDDDGSWGGKDRYGGEYTDADGVAFTSWARIRWRLDPSIAANNKLPNWLCELILCHMTDKYEFATAADIIVFTKTCVRPDMHHKSIAKCFANYTSNCIERNPKVSAFGMRRWYAIKRPGKFCYWKRLQKLSTLERKIVSRMLFEHIRDAERKAVTYNCGHEFLGPDDPDYPPWVRGPKGWQLH